MKPHYIFHENTIFSDAQVVSQAKTLVDALVSKGETLSTAESCTGGLIGSAITSISGASKIFEQGFITYANSAKEKLLGVSPNTLTSFGAVSSQTAYEMALGVCNTSQSTLGIAVTGIAGPTGGTPEKPVGLVYIGICYKNSATVFEYHFKGSRDEIRKNTVFCALKNANNIII